VGVCRVLSSDDDLLVLEPLTSLGTPPRIEIPPERVDLMTRETVTPVEAQEVLDLLAEAPEPLAHNYWTRRRRVYEEVVKESVLSELASHLRDLLGRKTPSYVERTLRDRLRSMVADELSVVLDLPRSKVLDLMERARRASLGQKDGKR